LVVQQELQPKAGCFSEGQKSRSSSDSNMVLKAAAKVLITDPPYESLGKVRYRYLLQKSFNTDKDYMCGQKKIKLQMALKQIYI
jgi:hypothetical protein